MSRTITMNGSPVTVEGEELKPGMPAPDFVLIEKTDSGLNEVRLADFRGKVLILSVVPSLDTSVCLLQTKRFNEEANKLPANCVVLTVSLDLPWAQERVCKQNSIGNVRYASDYRERQFVNAYGALVKPLYFAQRSLFVIDQQGVIRYTQYVNELTHQPDYEPALHVAREMATRA